MPIIHRHRLVALRTVVDQDRLSKVWKNTVHPGMRKQRLPDLHDYRDVHWHLDVFIENLRNDVLSGSYQPRQPDIAATEKGKGLRRHIIIPSPADALLLQSITDMWEAKVLASRPSKNAFYSRSHTKPDIEQLDSRVTYPWWVKWRQFIATIYEFKRDFPCIVVTDIANYFDNIDTTTLRNRLAGRARINEAELDLMLFILDSLKAKPFYGTQTAIGLPLIDFDAPRLLAMSYLYESDELLKRRTRNHFVRWMDDMDFGVKSVAEAHAILGELDYRLHGLNVRINTGKTKVMSRQDAEVHFCITENVRLNRIKDRLEGLKDRRQTKKWRKAVASFKARALSFIARMSKQKSRTGHWEKVYLRYLGLAGFTECTAFESEVRQIVLHYPGLRSKAISYLRTLGYSPKRLSILQRMISTKSQADPCACCDAAEVVTQWEVPTSAEDRARIGRLIASVTKKVQKGGPPLFVSGLMLCAKYHRPADLGRYVRNHLRSWRHSTWALRQVAACVPLLVPADAKWATNRIVESGAPDAIRVIANIGYLSKTKTLVGNKPLSGYARWNDKPPYGYSLSRFLINAGILTGSLSNTEKQALFNHLYGQVSDPVFLRRYTDIAIGAGLTIPHITPPRT